MDQYWALLRRESFSLLLKGERGTPRKLELILRSRLLPSFSSSKTVDFEILRFQQADTLPQGSRCDSEGSRTGGDRLEGGLRSRRSSSRRRTSDWMGVLGRLRFVVLPCSPRYLELTYRPLLACLSSPEPDAGIINFYSPGSSFPHLPSLFFLR